MQLPIEDCLSSLVDGLKAHRNSAPLPLLLVRPEELVHYQFCRYTCGYGSCIFGFAHSWCWSLHKADLFLVPGSFPPIDSLREEHLPLQYHLASADLTEFYRKRGNGRSEADVGQQAGWVASAVAK